MQGPRWRACQALGIPPTEDDQARMGGENHDSLQLSALLRNGASQLTRPSRRPLEMHRNPTRSLPQSPLRHLDHKRHNGCTRTANVERGRAPCALNLIVARLLANLSRSVEHHAGAGGSHRVTTSDETP